MMVACGFHPVAVVMVWQSPIRFGNWSLNPPPPLPSPPNPTLKPPTHIHRPLPPPGSEEILTVIWRDNSGSWWIFDGGRPVGGPGCCHFLLLPHTPSTRCRKAMLLPRISSVQRRRFPAPCILLLEEGRKEVVSQRLGACRLLIFCGPDPRIRWGWAVLRKIQGNLRWR